MIDDAGLDPEVVRVLQVVAQIGAPPYETVGAEQARQQFDAVAALRVAKYGVDQVKSVEDRVIAGPGGDLPVRVYWPREPAAGPMPVVLFLHGGGWTVGNVESYDAQARATCERTGAVTVSVDYRLAPEHPYPAAFDDACAALVWTAEHAAELGGDPARIGVWGDSAGGNLAAAVSLWARDQGGPAIKAQCLVYPSLDLTRVYPSFERYAEGLLLTAATSLWFGFNYVPNMEQRTEPYASPMIAPSHAGLPPAVVAVASHDVLADQGEAYVAKLQEAGVPVWHRTYPGLVHVFYALDAIVGAAREARDEICAELRKLLLAD